LDVAAFLDQVSFLGGDSSCRLYVNINGYESEFLSTLRTFAVMLMNNLVRRLELWTIIQHMTASLTSDMLRHKPHTKLVNESNKRP